MGSDLDVNRRRVCDEILRTEETYMSYLNIIKTCFESPLEDSGIVPAYVKTQIFSNIDQLICINQELLKELKVKRVAEAFSTLTPFLKLYANYARCHEMALATMIEWEQKCKEFAQFRRKQESLEEVKGQKLNALLIMPVQRIPRYKLLLVELLKYTNCTDEDYPKLKSCVEAVGKIAEYINTHMKEYDNRQRILEIQKRLQSDKIEQTSIMEPGRRLIKEGQLHMVLDMKHSKVHERMVFLFSDMFMHCRLRHTKYLDSIWLPLHKCSINTIHLSELKTTQPNFTTLVNTYQPGGAVKISCMDEDLIICSKSNKEINGWLESIKSAISVYRSDRSSLRKESSGRRIIRSKNVGRAHKRPHKLLPVKTLSPSQNLERSILERLDNCQTLHHKQTADKCASLFSSCTPRRRNKRRDSLL